MGDPWTACGWPSANYQRHPIRIIRLLLLIDRAIANRALLRATRGVFPSRAGRALLC